MQLTCGISYKCWLQNCQVLNIKTVNRMSTPSHAIKRDDVLLKWAGVLQAHSYRHSADCGPFIVNQG